MASIESNVKAAAQDVKKAGIVRSADAAESTAVEVSNHVIEQSEEGDLYEALGSIVAKLNVFVGIIDEVSKVSMQLSTLQNGVKIAIRFILT